MNEKLSQASIIDGPPPSYNECLPMPTSSLRANYQNSSSAVNNKLPMKGSRLALIVMMCERSFQDKVALSAELDEQFVRELDPEAKFKTDYWPGKHWKVSCRIINLKYLFEIFRF